MFGLLTCLALLALLIGGTLRRAPVAFAAVLCLYGLKQWGQNSSAFLADHRTLANWAVAALVLVGFLRARTATPRGSLAMPQPWLLGLALCGYAFVTLAWSPNIKDALNQWTLEAPYLLMIVVVAPFLLTSSRDVDTAGLWTITIGGALCTLALLAGTWGDRGLRIVGDLYQSQTNPLAIASLGGTIFTMALVALPTPMAWTKRILYLLMAVAGLAVMLRSGSRGQVAAAAAATLMAWPLALKGKKVGSLVLLLAVVGAIGWVGATIWDELGINSARWTGDQSSADAEGRLQMASTLLSKTIESPMTLLFGLSNSSSFHYVGFYPHITALEVIAEEGLVGAALYLLFLFSTGRYVFRLNRLSRDSSDPYLSRSTAVLTALVIFEGLLTLKQGTLISSTYFIAYGALLGRLYEWAVLVPATDALPVAPPDEPYLMSTTEIFSAGNAETRKVIS